jgi:hypothetical protein
VGDAVLSTISTTLAVLRDVTGALQSLPYVRVVAVAAVKVLEIREVCFSLAHEYYFESVLILV